jgi:endonuclease/exonuclease/phosphatase family metal-dependent hydrolase
MGAKSDQGDEEYQMKTNQTQKANQPPKRAVIILSVLMMMIMVLACGGTSNSTPVNTDPTATRLIPTKTPYVTATVPGPEMLTATASALQAHADAVRFMSYNIRDGGKGDKLPIITSILQAYNADVLAIQEANGWNANDFAIANQVASDLGMEYIYCQADSGEVDKAGNTYDLVLLSKLEIKSSEIFTSVQNCLIRAEVITASGQTVQVFATHIRSNFDEVGCENVEKIAKVIKPFAQNAAIFMGDVTMPPPGIVMGYPESQIACPALLVEAGFLYFTADSQVDQIWVTETLLANQSYKLPNASREPLLPKTTIRNASDHSPLAVDFYIP